MVDEPWMSLSSIFRSSALVIFFFFFSYFLSNYSWIFAWIVAFLTSKASFSVLSKTPSSVSFGLHRDSFICTSFTYAYEFIVLSLERRRRNWGFSLRYDLSVLITLAMWAINLSLTIKCMVRPCQIPMVNPNNVWSRLWTPRKILVAGIVKAQNIRRITEMMYVHQL